MQIAIDAKRRERLDTRDADAVAMLVYQSNADQYTTLSSLYATGTTSVTRE